MALSATENPSVSTPSGSMIVDKKIAAVAALAAGLWYFAGGE